MSEEEIIDYFENQDNSIKWDYKTLQAIKGLLDLYNKEKQKYNDMINCCNELMKQISKEKDLNNELQIRYKIEHDKYLEEKNKNKTIEIFSQHMPANTEIVCMRKEDFERNFSGDYITKDKIKQKIEELKKEMAKDEIDEFGIHSIGWGYLDYTVDFLQELLEEYK